MMNKRAVLVGLLGLTISGLSFFWAFKNVPVYQLVSVFEQMEVFWIIPSVLLVIAAFLFRALRWKMILATHQNLTFGEACHPLFIGFMINCVIPARIGEVVRPVILKARSGINFSAGLSSVVIERFFDLLFLITCLFVMMNGLRIDPDIHFVFGGYEVDKQVLLSITGKLTLICHLLALAILPICFNRTRNILKNIISMLPDKLCRPVLTIFDNTATVFMPLKKIKTLVSYVTVTCIIWGLHALSYFVMSNAFNGIELSFFGASYHMVIICFFITLPSVPGYWGLWEAGGIFALTLLGYPEDIGAAYTLVNHAIQVLPVMGIGWASLILIGFRIKDISIAYQKDYQK